MKYSKISSLLGSGILAWANLYPISAFAAQVDHSSIEVYSSHASEDSSHQSNHLIPAQHRHHGPKRQGNILKKIKQKYKTYKRQRHEAKYYDQEFRSYLKRNAQRYPMTWRPANEIATYATKMIEKHYDGINSIVAGVACLESLRTHIADPDALRDIRNHCHDQLQEFKYYKRQKHLSEEQLAIAEHEFQVTFPMYPELVGMLTNALTSDMECSIRGGSASGAWFLGASLGGYRLKCTTPLGRREVYAKINTAGTVGWGGDVSVSAPNYVRRDGHVVERTFRVPMDIAGYRPSLLVRSGAAIGLGANTHTNIPLG